MLPDSDANFPKGTRLKANEEIVNKESSLKNLASGVGLNAMPFKERSGTQ
jgi:hypothetical protein